jgi:Na+-transporting NADH:ubiquinone oxidoreductase subunit NqrC
MFDNEKFLVIVVIVLSLIIGALIHTIYLQRKDIKNIEKSYKHSMNFVDRLLNNIATREGVDVKKYIDMTTVELNNIKKGGANNG